MDKHLEEDILMTNLMKELPMSNQMPEHVRTKALNIAVESHRKAQAARRPRAAAWFTVGIAAFAVGTLVLMPRPAKAWSMVAEAVEKITSVQMDLLVKEKSGKEEKIQIAVQGSEMMLSAGSEGTVLYIGKDSMEVYEKKSNTLTRMKMPLDVAQFMPNVSDELVGAFDLKKEIADMEKKHGKDHIRIMPIRTGEDGRQVYSVQMTEKEGPGIAFMTVDAKTDLPIFINASGDKGENVVIHLRYNNRGSVRPSFPADAKINEVDLGNMQHMLDPQKLEKAFKDFNLGDTSSKK